MKTYFLVFGYGVPKDIFKDEHYNLYLKQVFNAVFDEVFRRKLKNPEIIFCGGPTSMFKPYDKTTEADEMIKFFKFLSERPQIAGKAQGWIFKAEGTSLSSLENFLEAKRMLKNKIRGNGVVIFCEKTRTKRIKAIAAMVFPEAHKVTVRGIDFDVGEVRYDDPKFIAQKERREIAHAEWALQSPDHLKQYHQAHEKN